MEESQSNLLVSRVLRLAILALGVVLATKLVPGIYCDDGWTLLAVVVVLTLFNSFLKPLLVLFVLPFLVATLGIGIILINALVLFLVGHVVKGFQVGSFGAAIFGAIIISVTNLCVTLLIRKGGPPRPPRGGGGGRRRDNGEVIDI
ncbi:MAG TPA: phage holin family protein [Opitutaceae bacterium]